jgi:hypothetical protein
VHYISVLYNTGGKKEHVGCSDMFSSRNMRRQVHIKLTFTVRVAHLLCYFYVPSTPGVTPLQIFRVIFLKVSTRAGRVMKQQFSRDDTLCRLARTYRRFENARSTFIFRVLQFWIKLGQLN